MAGACRRVWFRVSCVVLLVLLALAPLLGFRLTQLRRPESPRIRSLLQQQPEELRPPGPGTPQDGAPRAGGSAWPDGPPPPGARARSGGGSPPSSRATPGGPPPSGVPPPQGGFPFGARPRPGGASPPGAGANRSGSAPAVHAKPGDAAPRASARATGPSGADAHAPPGGHARARGAPPPGARAPPTPTAVPAPGVRAPPTAVSPPGARAPPTAVPFPGPRAPPTAVHPPGARAPPGGVPPSALARPSRRSPPSIVHAAPPPPSSTGKGSAPRPQGKAKAAAAPPPPSPPSPSKPSAEQKKATNIVLFIGCVYSLVCFSGPIITYWSTKNSIEATHAFHGWWDLCASLLGAFAWLLFGISQIHIEEGQPIGVTAVVVNSFGVAFFSTYIVVKLAIIRRIGTRVCVGVMLGLLVAYIGMIVLAVFTPFKKDSKQALAISFIAFFAQILSQGIPLLSAFPRLLSMMFPPAIEQRSPHINTRKLIVFFAFNNFAVSMLWAAYCLMRFEYDYFALGNVVGAALSFVSLVLHLVYALRPHGVDAPPPAQL